MDLRIIFANTDLQPEIYDFNETEKAEILGIQLKGAAALSYNIAFRHSETPIAKIQVNKALPKPQFKEIREHVPDSITIELVEDDTLAFVSSSRAGKTVEQKQKYMESLIDKYATKESKILHKFDNDKAEQLLKDVETAVKVAQEYFNQWKDDTGDKGNTVITAEWYIKKSNKVREKESKK